jgi:putative ABC transport system permease protein
MRPHTLLYFYGRWVRRHPIQELLAGLGIAIGVALTFATLVANGSISGSAKEVTRGIFGSADLQLAARHSRGFDERLVSRVSNLPGVAHATALLEQRAILVGPTGKRAAVQFAGADPGLARLQGAFTRNFSSSGLEVRKGLLLPSATATALGLPATYAQARTRLPPPRVSLHIRGRTFKVPVGAVLGREVIGPLAEAMGAFAPRPDLQRYAALPGRVTRVLVDAAPGREAFVRSELRALAGGRLTVSSPEADVGLLEQAMKPIDQATTGLAVISALVGFLLAFNAMLLTTPDRRRTMADLRIQGFRPGQLVQMHLFQAAVLGAGASAVGLLAGNVLARTLYRETPDYLASAFGFGTQTIVTLEPLLLSFGGGTAAAFLAAAAPLLDLRRGRPVDAVYHEGGEPGNAIAPETHRRLVISAVGLLILTSGLVLIAPSAALLANVGLALATVLVIPPVLQGVLRACEFLVARGRRLGLVAVALFALKATTLRSLALAATGAVAVFGSVAVGGARHDLLGGIERYVQEYVGSADLWVVNGADDQATKDFPRGDLVARVSRAPGVESVRAYHGGYFNFAGRRLWLIARSGAGDNLIPPSEIVRGDLAKATARLRTGGWITVSDQLAKDRGVAPGDVLNLPTPTGDVGFRIAATTTNLTWAPGAIILNSGDYRRAWNTSDPTALEIDLRRGAEAEAVKPAVRDALGPEVALQVQTARERADQANAVARQGLNRLSQISMLLLIAASLAMAAALAAAIWQRRAALAGLRLQSFRPGQLARLLVLEAGVVLGAGCVTGALSGAYGHALIDRYLRLTTGFPVPFAPAGWQTVESILLVLAAALALVAVPAYLAANASPRLGLQE